MEESYNEMIAHKIRNLLCRYHVLKKVGECITYNVLTDILYCCACKSPHGQTNWMTANMDWNYLKIEKIWDALAYRDWYAQYLYLVRRIDNRGRDVLV